MAFNFSRHCNKYRQLLILSIHKFLLDFYMVIAHVDFTINNRKIAVGSCRAMRIFWLPLSHCHWPWTLSLWALSRAVENEFGNAHIKKQKKYTLDKSSIVHPYLLKKRNRKWKRKKAKTKWFKESDNQRGTETAARQASADTVRRDWEPGWESSMTLAEAQHGWLWYYIFWNYSKLV